MTAISPQERSDVRVELLTLVHSFDAHGQTNHTPHIFAYQIRITNESEETVVLNSRKWILKYEDGEQEVYEGDGIVGKIVMLEPEESFEYGSFHMVGRDCAVEGAYHGYSDTQDHIWARIPKFHLHIPDKLA